MVRYYVAIVSVLALVAYSESPGVSEGEVGSAIETVRVDRHTLDSIRIAVPVQAGSLEAGECASAPPPPLRTEAPPLHMVWGPPNARVRRVMVTLDTAGQLVRFTDLGGAELYHRPDGHTEPGTSIHLEVEAGLAFIKNHRPMGDPETVAVQISEAMESEALGNPAQIIEYIVNHCTRE